MFVFTQQAIDEQNARVANKAGGYMAAGADHTNAVPSAAEGHVGNRSAPHVPPGGAIPVIAPRTDSPIAAEQFNRPYIAEGHAANSPANYPQSPGLEREIHGVPAYPRGGSPQDGAAKALEPVHLSWRVQVGGAGPIADLARSHRPTAVTTRGIQ